MDVTLQNPTLEGLAGRLHSEVPILPADRPYVRLWRGRGNLFTTAAMGLLPVQETTSPPSSPLETNSHTEKVHFLSDVSEFLNIFDSADMTMLREAEFQNREGSDVAPFALLRAQLQDILHPQAQRTSATGLPLRRQTEAGHTNTIFDILQMASPALRHDSQVARIESFQNSTADRRVYLLLNGHDLVAAYGRLKDDHGISHELFLHEALAAGSPILSAHTDGLRSVAEQAEHFQLVVVSVPSST